MNPIDLTAAFAGRPDLAPLAQKISTSATDFSSSEKIQRMLAESRAHESAGNLAAALDSAQRALDTARRDNDAVGIVGGLAHLARAHWRMGHYAQATHIAEQGIAEHLAIPDTVTCMSIQGMCATETNDLAFGEEAFHRAADLSRQIDYRLGLSLSLHNLAHLVYYPRGQFDLALKASAESYHLDQKMGIPNWGHPLAQAIIYQITGEREKARDALRELQQVARPGNLIECVYCSVSARIALDEENLDQAEKLLARASELANALGNPNQIIYVRINLARYRRLSGDAPAARAWADEAVAYAQRVGYHVVECWSLIERAQAAWAIPDLGAVETDLHAATQIGKAMELNYELARATFFLAALYHQQQRDEAEATWLDAAQQIIRGGYVFILEREKSLAFPLIAAYLHSRQPDVRASAEQLLDPLTRVPPLPLRVIGLGRFEVWQGRRRIANEVWSKRKVGELVRFLLCQPHHTAPRELVLESLWQETSLESSQALLHQATFTLRHILEPELPNKFPSRYLTVESDTVALYLPSGSSLDFEQFEIELRRALTQNTMDDLSNACALYAGDLFPNDRYVDWAAAPRERLLRLYLRGLLALAERQLAEGHAQDALDSCQRLLERDTWQEDAVLVAMRASLALNDRPGALRLYRNLERTLRQDMNLAPRTDLIALAQSIR